MSVQILVALFLVAVCSIAVTAQPPQVAEAQLFEQAYLAKDNGFGQPGEASTVFSVTDIPIHCVVVLSNIDSATVKMDLIAVSVRGLKADSEIISTSYTTKDMQDRVFFNGRPNKLWFAGEYRADIYIDGNLVGKFPFTITGPAGVPGPAMNLQPKKTERPRPAAAKKT